MLLIIMSLTVILNGYILATAVYRRTRGDWPLNIGVSFMVYGTIFLAIVLLLGFSETIWGFFLSQVNQLRSL